MTGRERTFFRETEIFRRRRGIEVSAIGNIPGRSLDGNVSTYWSTLKYCTSLAYLHLFKELNNYLNPGFWSALSASIARIAQVLWVVNIFLLFTIRAPIIVEIRSAGNMQGTWNMKMNVSKSHFFPLKHSSRARGRGAAADCGLFQIIIFFIFFLNSVFQWIDRSIP